MIELERRAFEAASKEKKMRAVLALLWCKASCGNYLQDAPIAVAYELAHAAAIVQDDVIDHSELRRGERSVLGQVWNFRCDPHVEYTSVLGSENDLRIRSERRKR